MKLNFKRLKFKNLAIILFAFSIILLTDSCKKDDKDDDKSESKISKHNDDESHKSGQNCMTCHKNGGEGEGIFTFAGTVYDSTKTNVYPNTTVEVYSEANGGGILVMVIQVDGKGNFYTTESFNFGEHYTLVKGNTSMHMNSKITTGACNSCHGNSTDKIWTK